MAERIPTVAVSPQGAGTISIEIHHMVETTVATDYVYKVTTTDAAGYRFSHFHVEATDMDGEDYEYDSYPPFVPFSAFTWEDRKDESPSWGDKKITAVYTALVEVVATVSAAPAEARQAGCTATVDGSTSSSFKYGAMGETVSFYYAAQANGPWRFVRWENIGGGLGPKTEKEFRHYHYIEGLEGVTWRAVFTPKTNLIIRDADGKIVRDAQGRIVRDY